MNKQKYISPRSSLRYDREIIGFSLKTIAKRLKITTDELNTLETKGGYLTKEQTRILTKLYGCHEKALGRIVGYGQKSTFDDFYPFAGTDITVQHELFTLGYQKLKSIDDMRDILINNDISHVYDVRHNPISRGKSFGRKPIHDASIALEDEGYTFKFRYWYFWFPRLGIPSKIRNNATTNTARKRMFAYYQYRLQENKVNPWIEFIVQYLAVGVKTVLLCQEHDPAQCHRAILANYIQDNYKEIVTNVEFKSNKSAWLDHTALKQHLRERLCNLKLRVTHLA